jgi:hypothetical protein
MPQGSSPRGVRQEETQGGPLPFGDAGVSISLDAQHSHSEQVDAKEEVERSVCWWMQEWLFGSRRTIV